MSSDSKQPFINSQAFDWDTETYVAFPSQSDAMLASLLLFHEIERDTMDLVFSVVTHPDFDSKQVSLRNSDDVDSIVEKVGSENGVAVDSEEPQQPFVECRALDQNTETYFTFPSQADAMLASLLLFHNVERYIIDTIFSVATHPDFDSKNVTLRSWGDVMDAVEERRLKDRMAVVHKRSLDSDGHMVQAGLPHFVLEEVLDIIHCDRLDSIESAFEQTWDEEMMYFNSMDIEEDHTLKAMTRVHRSWTYPAQKALGRVLHIGRPTDEMTVLLNPVRKSIFGPWTSVVAVQFFHPIDEVESVHSSCSCYTCHGCGSTEITYEYLDDDDASDDYRQWFETLHRMLVGFTNLKFILIKSYAPIFTEWSNSMFEDLVRRNIHLKEITLYAKTGEPFTLDPLIGNSRILESLKTLNISNARFSDAGREKAMQVAMQAAGFPNFSTLTLSRSSRTLHDDFTMLSILSAHPVHCLTSLQIIDDTSERSFEKDMTRALAPSRCAILFNRLRTLHIYDMVSADQWLKWIIPYCSSLESLSITKLDSWHSNSCQWEDIIRQSSTTQYTAVFEHLISLHIDSGRYFYRAKKVLDWIGPHFSRLESLTIVHGDKRILESRASSLHVDSKREVDLWLKWVYPHRSNARNFTFSTKVDMPPTTAHLIPAMTQNLSLLLMTMEGRGIGDISNWIKCLLKTVSSRQFSELKSIAVSVSRNRQDYLQREYGREEVRRLRAEMQKFEEEMRTACKCVGIECSLGL